MTSTIEFHARGTYRILLITLISLLLLLMGSVTVASGAETAERIVTFDSRGGSSVNQKVVSAGSAIGTMPVSTRTGYSLSGWFTAINGGTKIEASYVPAGDITLYAQWLPLTFEMKFYDGATLLRTVTLPYDHTLTASSGSAPTKEGLTFEGWYTAASGGARVEKVTQAQTLYARYTTSVYTVNYYSDDGVTLIRSETVAHGSPVIAGPTRTGFTFTGWFVSPTSNSQITTITRTQDLYARYRPVMYTVRLYDGATFIESISAPHGFQMSALDKKLIPEKVGYTLAGWYTAANGGTKVETIHAAQTLYARYTPNTYTVTYNAQGGSVTPASSTVNHGSSVTLPTPTRTGFTFNGWFTAASGGTRITSPYSPTENITLHAQWTQITYVVTYNANGGSVSPTSNTVNAGSSVTLPTPTRTGFTFNGWFTAASGGTRVTSPYTPTAAITLFAQWTQITYTVTYNAQGGSVTPTNSTVNHGNAVTLPTPTRTGFTFNGWFTAATGGTRIGVAGASYTPTAAITLHAQWTQITYTVTYNAQGGSVTPASSTVNHGSSVTLPTPVRSGYTFNGWFTAATGGTRINSPYTPTTAITLFAQWSLNPPTTKTVILDRRDGSPATSVTVTVGTQIGSQLITPSRAGHTFNGWFTQATGGTRMLATQVITEDITLYAQWTINRHTINYYSADGKTLLKSETMDWGSSLNAGSYAPKQTGKTFSGWFTAVTGGSNVNTVSANQNVYARYVTTTYTVTYFTHAGVQHSVGSVSHNGAPAAGIKRTGYTFVGWFTAQTGGTQVTKITANRSLYARYTINQYTTKYYSHTGALLRTTKTNYNTNPIAGPARTGFTFQGWFTAKTGGTRITKITANRSLHAQYKIKTYSVKYHDGSKLLQTRTQNHNTNVMAGPKKTGYTFVGWFTAQTGGTQVTKITANRTLYARYKINQYTIKYYNHTGATLLRTVKANYNTKLANSIAPARTGFRFVGWFTAKTGGTQVTTFTANRSVYARYIQQVTIHYYTDTGVLIKTEKVDINSTLKDSLAPKKNGFGFEGWYTARTGGTRVTGKITKNMSVYARYVSVVP